MSYWRDKARAAIQAALAALPADATLAERTRAIDAAYPFGPREHHPYRMWLVERRAALRPFKKQTPAGPLFGELP